MSYNKIERRKLGITRWKPNNQNLKKKKVIATIASISQSNTENSHQAISDKQIPTDSTNIIREVLENEWDKN
ncbi:3119_t:CDS:2 [Funneliformis caledonium]|uniref:3119_t:CDS:1 n=1 Tax=Funneliformis caledonium TaxID=1117310 RepID=A0A9N8VGP3_9GLOM|nr:3119_t:CDS:2 [Funneliformis caledonium]